MRKTGAEMPVNLVYKEHMLSHLRIQSFLYASGMQSPYLQYEAGHSLILIAHLSF
jgi:hypothetical protein